MITRPSFVRELTTVLWFFLKVGVPIAAWGAFVLWWAYPSVVLMSWTLYGSCFIGLVVFLAWSSYRSKQRGAQWQKEREIGYHANLSDSLGIAHLLTRAAPPPPAQRQLPAKMPVSLLKPPARRIDEMAIGSEAYINFAQILVDEDLSCYVFADTRLSSNESFMRLLIRRDEEGLAAVIPKGKDVTFTPSKLSELKRDLLPIVRIEETD